MAAPARPSAAIQIVRPPTAQTVPSPKAPGQAQPSLTTNVDKDKRKDTTQRICRNVAIYGACKFQDNGCVYYHPPPGADMAALSINGSQAPTPTLQTPVLKDSKGLTSELGAEHLSAPVFVPKTPMAEAASPRATTPVPPARDEGDQGWPEPGQGGLFGPDTSLQQPVGHGFDSSSFSMGGSQMDNGMYMPHHPVRQTLDYHLYTAPLPHVANPPISSHPLHSFFIPDDLRRTLTSRHEATYISPQMPTGLPAEVGVYHSLLPLGQPPVGMGRVYGHPCHVYRATSTVDGNVYAMRRVEGFKLVNEAAFGAIETWRRMKHPNIVGLREAFTTKAFNDNSLIFIFDFHPDSKTLWDEHLNPHPDPAVQASNMMPLGRGRAGMPIQERQLWSFVTQIANAIKAIHNAGQSARNLDPSKILITGKNRIRLNGLGILDVLAHDSVTPISAFQQEDLVSFGKLVISMACDFFTPGQHPAEPVEHIKRMYSPDVKNLVLYLISRPGPSKSIDEVIRMIGTRMLNEFDAMQIYSDVLEAELGTEVENGRIARLLIKLGFINERAEFELDTRWSETGDRYILKLFRDYVFHSIGVDGSPVLDLSHVLTSLNKLDAGLDEKIMLVSRDDQSCLVVTYREIKACIEAAYSELRNSGGARGLLMHR